MHATSEQIQHLAISYYKKQLLTDEELEVKYHMSECDSCYERFCAELLMLRTLGDNGFVEVQMLEAEGLETEPIPEQKKAEIPFLRIRLVQEKMELLLDAVQEPLSGLWNFMQSPTLSYSRGAGRNSTDSDYISQESEYSCVQRRKGQIRIQLDEEYFPVRKLAVKYIESGQCVYKAFDYDDYSECFVVVIEESVPQNGEIEIVEV